MQFVICLSCNLVFELSLEQANKENDEVYTQLSLLPLPEVINMCNLGHILVIELGV